MLVDSHCHLDFPDFAEELDAVVARAGAAGVGMMLTIGTRLGQFDGVRTVAERFDNEVCSVGVHPHEAAAEGPASPEPLLGLVRHLKVVGIGETGLDYYYDHSPREAQRKSFRTHIATARASGLPLIVHSRNADEDMGEILAEEMEIGAFSGVMHCFSSGRQLAETAVESGLYVSLSGIVTFNKAEAVREIARWVPQDRLLVETDAPYLAPVPNRGKRNEPAFVVHTAERVAILKDMSVEALAAATSDNFLRLFTKAGRPA